MIPGEYVLMFIGIFIIAEAIFSIIHYFEGSPLPHIFRAIRSVIGAYLIWIGANYSISESWSTLVFLLIIGLCILSGYEVAIVLEGRGKSK